MESHVLLRNEMEIPHTLYPVSLNLFYCYGNDSITRYSQAWSTAIPSEATMLPLGALLMCHSIPLGSSQLQISCLSFCWLFQVLHLWSCTEHSIHSSVSFLAVFTCVSLRSKHRALNMLGYRFTTEPHLSRLDGHFSLGRTFWSLGFVV